MILANQVAKRFGPVSALAGVSFRVERLEMVAVIGASGAGKTTLLRLLSTYMAPSSGYVEINGVDTVHDSLAVRRMLGYLPERDPVYPGMRVLEYLTFRAQLRGLSGRTRTKRIRELIGRCGLAGLERALMGGLSKGEVRRVLLADSLVGDPALVLLDEPTLGLDPLNGDRVRSAFMHLKGERTVLFSTHDMGEAAALASRVLILDRGRVAALGTPGDLLQRYQATDLGMVVKRIATGGGGAP